MQELDAIYEKVIKGLETADTPDKIEEIRVAVLGKKGELTQFLRGISAYPPEERPKIGQLVNAARERIEAVLAEAQAKAAEEERKKALLRERIDVTIPGKKPRLGKLHPLTKVHDEIVNIFLGMGFTIEEGPEIEYDLYNFELLNIPREHPSRDMHDTFFVSDDVVLRTHTSPVQVRTMLKKKPPIRILSPGRVYRTDNVDATHSPIFHQIEGLVVDKGITMGDLMGVLTVFAKELYGESTITRFRPSYFPFTEPSTEVDISCTVCGGSGCRVCKGTGWIEILGAGVVNPKVLANCGIDPNEYAGFAFGMGLDRVTNMKYGISDIRLLFENDVRFLEQF